MSKFSSDTSRCAHRLVNDDKYKRERRTNKLRIKYSIELNVTESGMKLKWNERQRARDSIQIINSRPNNYTTHRFWQ